jgi:ribonuclease H / adenosylcobalamin/alpha-ribazole phosphatase
LIAHFIRHGESVSNAAPGRDLSDADGDRLTDLGHQQAALAAQHLGNLRIDRLWSSPLRRAQETAAPIADALGLQVEIHDDLQELREGDAHYELSGEEQRLERWSARMHANAGDPTAAPPGGESFADMLARVERLKSLLLEHSGHRVLAVSHGILLRFLFVHSFLEDEFTPKQVGRLWQLRTVNCGLSAFQHRSVDEEVAYPSEGEWLCLTWMARPWDPL